MKVRLFLVIIVFMAATSALATAQTKAEDIGARKNSIGLSNSPNSPTRDEGATTFPATPAPVTKDASQDYETALVTINERFSATLATIIDAVQKGELSSQKGKSLSAEQYLLAEMQFQLLSAWQLMPERNPDRVPASNSADQDIVLVDLPFLTLDLTPSLANDLSLTESQLQAIQGLMARERHEIEPLIQQLQTTREQLLDVDAQQHGERELKRLADAQAALLAKLIIVSGRMQSNIYQLLTPEQKRKFDDFNSRRESETTVTR